jgi:ribosome biogenesis protein ENP2
MAEEVQADTYDNYKFLTVPELKSLSLAHLVGKTNLLRPYMHGFFVASKLYDQARLIANPYVWEEERMKRVKEKVDKERASRIRGKKVKVNQKLVDRALKRQERREKVDTEAGFLGDSRFKQLFEDEAFAVDESSREFQLLNSSVPAEGLAETDPKQIGNSTGSADEDGSDSEGGIRTREGGVVMRTSSSLQKQGPRSRDTALGSRQQKVGRVDKIRRGDAAGEKQITFMPQTRQKERRLPEKPNRQGPRRSASTNTFRKL